jgi:hypothetical protein
MATSYILQREQLSIKSLKIVDRVKAKLVRSSILTYEINTNGSQSLFCKLHFITQRSGMIDNHQGMEEH